MRRLIGAVLAGAAGTSALNAVTYLDMALRGRPASTTPQDSVQRFAEAVRLNLGAGDRAENRKNGLGPLLGIGTGVGVAVAYAAGGGSRLPRSGSAMLLTGLAMVAGNAPMAVSGITDPRRWSAGDWISDVVPHVAYGIVTAAALDRCR
jgi:hypothetical protein